jgi:hypothetical protein
VRCDLNIRLLLMYHQSCFIFAESGFTRSGPGLNQPQADKVPKILETD